MGFKKTIVSATGLSQDKVPSGYQVLGHVMLLKMPNISDEEKKIVAKAIMKEYNYVKTVCEIIQVDGELRQPIVQKIAGGGTETVHKEHGLIFTLDVSKVMFSKGNLSERNRLTKLVDRKETVVDMFAGIGYFSLGVGKVAKQVFAIEKNRDAYYYLCENIELNGLTGKVKPILGDCRTTHLDGVADRVIMGYFPDTEKFLPTALGFLKKKGMIHFHNIYEKDKIPNAEKSVRNIIVENGWITRRIKTKKVKSYAPRVLHVVMDISVARA
ncbi:MAG: class I SAM-dependent methyltransferase family protein [Candidatus Aenigmatarchaeota archaeon]